MFSVIITCYKEGRDLLRAVESVRRQTYKDYEIIVVKDYSTHSQTLAACHELEAEGVKVIYAEHNLGLSGARNIGIEQASFDYIQFLDADDELPENTLKNIADTIIKYGEVEAVFGDYILDTGVEKSRIICSNTDVITIKEYFRKHKIIGTLCYKKSLLQQIGGYSMKYSIGCQDVDLHLRLFENGVKYTYCPEVLYIWNKREYGMNTSTHNAESFDECMYEHRDFVAPYIGKRYLLGLLKSHGNKEEYCRYFRQYAPRWCRWATILPFPLLTKFARFVK
ncbi:MAG: glycosyltransferase [Paludibacteraceae bacterium]|nr:glycosyltransferase [Paludibacteraceae bacterium]